MGERYQGNKKAPPSIENKSYNSCSMSSIEIPRHWNRVKIPDLSDLISSIKTEGQLIPILVTEGSTPKKFLIIDGMRRYLAKKTLKEKTIFITYIQKKDAGNLLLKSMTTNLVRSGNTAYEIAKAFGKLVSEYNLSNDQIALTCGKTSGYVSQHLAVLKSDIRLQEALRDEKIPLVTFRHINKIDRIKDKKFHDKLVTLILNGTPTTILETKINAYLKKKKEKQTTTKKELKQKPARGGAAHKNNVSQLVFYNYDDPKVKKMMRPLGKKELISLVKDYSERAKAATSKNPRRYYEGVTRGLETALSLFKESL